MSFIVWYLLVIANFMSSVMSSSTVMSLLTTQLEESANTISEDVELPEIEDDQLDESASELLDDDGE